MATPPAVSHATATNRTWRALQHAFLTLLCMGFLAGCRAAEGVEAPELHEDPPPTPEYVDKRFESPEYGAQTFMWWRPDVAKQHVDLVDHLDFGWIKQEFPWRDIEGVEKGQYDWWRPDKIVEEVEKERIKLLVRLDRQPFWSQPEGLRPMENMPPEDLDDFGDFCYAVADRYQGRIHAYQVWNEPNLAREWGRSRPDPAGYVALLKVCYEAIKRADPHAIVISAGLAPTGTQSNEVIPDTEFLQAMYAAGAADYFDVLGLHAPGFKAPPETPPSAAEYDDVFGYGNGRWFFFRHVEDMRRIMIENGDAHKQVAILEMGWTTDPVNESYAWHAVTEAQKADYLVRAYEYAQKNWQPWVGLMVTIYIADVNWTEADEQYWWAITRPDGTPLPAYTALKEMIDRIQGGD